MWRTQLVDVYFPAAATTLVIQFDRQPTNRAGMNGQQPCALILSAPTVATLRGDAAAAPLCAWTDASTLVAYLTKFTHAGPGMGVEQRVEQSASFGAAELAKLSSLS